MRNFVSFIRPIKMSRDEFIFVKVYDEVRYVYCRIDVYNWEGDSMKEHEWFSLNCHYVNEMKKLKVSFYKMEHDPVRILL